MKLKQIFFMLIYYTLVAFVATKIKNYDYTVYMYATITGIVGTCIVGVLEN